MPPVLTETWGAAYLQVAVVLLVFAFGVPAVALQLILPSKIRGMLLRYQRGVKAILILSVGALAIIAVSFLWVLHPDFSWHLPDDARAWLSASVISLGIGLIGLLWGVVARVRSMKRLAESIKQRLLRRFRRSGRLDEGALADLLSLLKHPRSAAEFCNVFSILIGLAKSIAASEGYKGTELTELLRGILLVLQHDTIRCDPICLQHAISSLSALDRAKGLGRAVHDRLAVQQAIRAAGFVALETEHESAAMMVVDSLADYHPLLFGIGTRALQLDNGLVATAVLRKLARVTSCSEAITIDRGKYLIGLCARFWCKGGSAREIALSTLQPHSQFSEPLRTCLTKSASYFRSITDYETADALSSVEL